MASSHRVPLALLLAGSAVAFAGDTPKKAKVPATAVTSDAGTAPASKTSDAKAAGTGVAAARSPVQQAAAQEQEARPEATAAAPYAEFQFATLTGSSNVLNVGMLPVVTASGITYVNLTLTVNVAANGTITVAAGSPAVVATPVTAVSGFKVGNYVGPSSVDSGMNYITVNGPGVVAGGATVWSLTASAGANACTFPSSATWYVAAPTAANNPLAARLKAAGITSTAYSYGIGGAGCYGDWQSGSLIGVSQTGNSLTIVSFSSGGSNAYYDHNTPQDQITYTLH